jgi:hypothetical protein
MTRPFQWQMEISNRFVVARFPGSPDMCQREHKPSQRSAQRRFRRRAKTVQ